MNNGVFVLGGSKYQVKSVPLKQLDITIALVCVGERLDFDNFVTPVVLLHKNRVMESSLRGVRNSDIQRGVAGCDPQGECEITLPGSTYLSLATSFGDGYTLRSLVGLVRYE